MPTGGEGASSSDSPVAHASAGEPFECGRRVVLEMAGVTGGERDAGSQRRLHVPPSDCVGESSAALAGNKSSGASSARE